MSEDLRSALNYAICGELDAALSRVLHCVNQLSDEQLWHRPPHGMNAIGNLLLHLAGNVQQMIADNLTGAPDTRDRPAEFAARDAGSSEELIGKLLTTVQRARVAFVEASDERLAETTRVNNFDLTGINAAVRCVSHFRGHTQEIIHMTRELLGDKYQFAGPK
jgi:uncharacterized damage-inducible protein DinB